MHQEPVFTIKETNFSALAAENFFKALTALKSLGIKSLSIVQLEQIINVFSKQFHLSDYRLAAQRLITDLAGYDPTLSNDNVTKIALLYSIIKLANNSTSKKDNCFEQPIYSSLSAFITRLIDSIIPASRGAAVDGSALDAIAGNLIQIFKSLGDLSPTAKQHISVSIEKFLPLIDTLSHSSCTLFLLLYKSEAKAISDHIAPNLDKIICHVCNSFEAMEAVSRFEKDPLLRCLPTIFRQKSIRLDPPQATALISLYHDASIELTPDLKSMIERAAHSLSVSCEELPHQHLYQM